VEKRKGVLPKPAVLVKKEGRPCRSSTGRRGDISLRVSLSDWSTERRRAALNMGNLTCEKGIFKRNHGAGEKMAGDSCRN